MKSRPLISFCIPTYSRPNDVKRAVESILQQKAFDPKTMEIIVFDDAPQNPAEKMLKPLLKKYAGTLIYVLHPKNKGFDENILSLCQRARGKFLMFLTDDDTFAPNSIQNIVKTFEECPDIHFYACAYQIIVDGKPTRVHKAISESELISTNDYKKSAIMFKDTESLSGKAFAKDALDLNIYKTYKKSLYCHLVLAGTAVLSGPSYYYAEPLVEHIVGNEVFWKYSGDYMLADLSDLIDKVGEKHPEFIQEAKKQLFSSLPYITYINILSPQKLTPVIQTILQKKLYSLPVFWQGLTQGTVTTIKNKISQSL